MTAEQPDYHAAVRARFPAIDWHRAWAEQPDAVEWLVEPLVEVGRLVAVFSPPGVGKSLLSLEVAAGLATGRSVLGNPPRTRRQIVYVDLENGQRDIVERAAALGYAPDDLHGWLHYLSFPSLSALDSAAGGRELVAIVEAYGAVVVVIDTVSRVIAGDENDAATFAALYRHALAPLKARGITVVRLDHSGKDAERGQRGSSAKAADVDDVWMLVEVAPGRVQLRRQKSRHGHGASVVTLDRRQEPLRHVPSGDGGSVARDRVDALVAELDALDVPRDFGRDRARQALLAAGVSCGNTELAKALTRRRDLLTDAGTPALAVVRDLSEAVRTEALDDGGFDLSDDLSEGDRP